jgi:hypothetical protein
VDKKEKINLLIIMVKHTIGFDTSRFKYIFWAIADMHQLFMHLSFLMLNMGFFKAGDTILDKTNM